MRTTQRTGSTVWVTPPAVVTDAGIEGVLEELRHHLNGREPYAIVFDMTSAGVPTALQRRKLVDHMTANAAAIERMVLGLGVVVPSPLLRGAVTALFWVASPRVPYEMFASRHEAQAWAETMVLRKKAPASARRAP